jgi:magnesium transporter
LSVPRSDARQYGSIPLFRRVLQSALMANRSNMWKRLRRRSFKHRPPGAKPGTLAIQPDAEPTTIRVMAYDKEHCVDEKIDDPQKLKDFVAKWPVVWIDVAGLGSEDKLRAIADVFRIHPLALEDIVHVHQRAKVDPYDDSLYIVLRIPDDSKLHITEQFSLVLGKNFLLTFQERRGDCFDAVRSTLRQEQSAARQGMKPDYLAYRLIDAAIDAYFPVLETIGEHIDKLDDPDAVKHTRAAFADLHVVRRELLALRRAIWPLRDALSLLRSETTPFVSDDTRVYLRDCYDHAVQLLDLLESYRDIAGDVRDYYLSSISNRMNEIMTALTLIATIFLPLSFIASLYGMNFNPAASKWNMPELNWRYGYPYALTLMLVVAMGMILWFKRRGWMGRFNEVTADETKGHDDPESTQD